MEGERGRRVENQVMSRLESDLSLAPQGKFTSRPDRRGPGTNLRRVAGDRISINESKQYGNVGAMPLAGLGQ